MAAPRYQHTIQLPAELEEAWLKYQAEQRSPESFNSFALRIIQQEMELLCVIAAPTSTTQ